MVEPMESGGYAEGREDRLREVLARISILLSGLFFYGAVRSLRRKRSWRGTARLTAQVHGCAGSGSPEPQRYPECPPFVGPGNPAVLLRRAGIPEAENRFGDRGNPTWGADGPLLLESAGWNLGPPA